MSGEPKEKGTLTAEAVEGLNQGVKDATQLLSESRTQMDAANEKVNDLLKEQTDLKNTTADNTKGLHEVNANLQGLGDKMETIAKQYTETIDTLRLQTQQLSLGGNANETVWRARGPGVRGAIFTSRQEALELGMFLMATMKPENAAKVYARKWLQEHRQDLQFLPNIPKSFVEQVANPILTQEDCKRLDLASESLGMGQALTGGATPGSIFVRPQFVDTLIRNIEQHGTFRRNALVWPMGSDTVWIPRRKSGVAWVWEGEADAGTGTDPDFEQLGLIAKKGMMLHQFSSELSEDSAIQIADIFMFEFALEAARKEDSVGFKGDGTSGSGGYGGFQGVLGQAGHGTPATAESTAVPHLVMGAAGANLISEVTYAKLRTMLGRLHTWAEGGAKWYMHRTVLGDLAGIESTAGNLVVKFGQKLGDADIFGYPVERVDQMPATAIGASLNAFAFGDLRKSWILGDRRQTTVETSEHYHFNTDCIAIRMTARIAFLMTQGNGMVIYATGSA